MATLKVFTFAPDWGLPTVGPFALKLLAWLELAGLPYEQVFEVNPRKGPKGKNPWIELDGERIGDSELIIDLLRKRHAIERRAHTGAARYRTRLATDFRGALSPSARMGAVFPSSWGGLDARKSSLTNARSARVACLGPIS
jgi:glutathione S-transferase